MQLVGLDVGPIVGETTPNRVRIWGRAEGQIVNDMPRRCFGVLRYRKDGEENWSQSLYFKMNPNFDLTGIAVVDRLSSNQPYEYEIGYFYSDAELDDAPLREIDWSSASTGTFTTASDDDAQERSLIIGSCRYLLKTFLGSFFDDRGDKTFRSIVRQIEGGDPVHQLIMMGDQIYADDLNVLSPDKTIGMFYKRYRDAFSQKHIRSLMSRVPTYMTLDDHEIEDNWPSKATDKDWKTLFPVAIHAYLSYQLSHSPNIPVRGRRLQGTPEYLWYKYTDGCVDVFVTDSRTERYPGDEVDWDQPSPGREIIGMKQMTSLKRWLSDNSGRVKIVVTSVPFFPDSSSKENNDKWSGFVKQRQEILSYIESKKIEKVVFCSGDVHASFSAELVSPTGLKLFSVVSSAFFWPYPHPSAKHFRRSGTIDGGTAGQFTLQNVSKIIGDDNFTRLNISPTAMEVRVFGRKGGPPISTNQHQLI